MNEGKQLVRERRVEALSVSEKKKLQQLILGYGNLKDNAKRANVHHQTLKNIATLGKGESETLRKVRETILA